MPRTFVFLRIALISDHASPIAVLGGVDTGGQNVYVAQLAAHLARMGHEVAVYTRRDDPDLADTVEMPEGYSVVNVAAGPARPIAKEELLPHMRAFSDQMYCKLSREECDIVHANFFMSGMVAMRLKTALQIPFVVTFHALGRVRLLYQAAADRFPIERLSIEDRIVAEADRIIAECPQDAEDQISLYSAEPSKLRMAACGFDRGELQPIDRALARRALGLDLGVPIVLQLGRLVPRKGVDNAIRGFARMVRVHNLDARMLIVGGATDMADPIATPEIGRLQEIAKQEHVAEHVIFTGRADRQRLKYYYSAADVFVTTPWYEPFGITPLESMACGTPVIGANVGGIKYSVVDGRTGFLVPPNDPDALGQRLAQLAGDAELRRDSLGRRCAASNGTSPGNAWRRPSTIFIRKLSPNGSAPPILPLAGRARALSRQIGNSVSRGISKS